MTYALLQLLEERKLKADNDKVQAVYDWFAEKYVETTQITKKQIDTEATASAGVGATIFGIGLKVLARVKSVISGSVESRQKVRLNVSQYADTLLAKLNLLLAEVSRALKAAGHSGELLIVVDNLDRLDPEPGRRLFISNGPLLKQLDAHVIYTVPIALALAPEQIGRIFESGFTIPTMNPKKKAARQALIDLISERIDIDAVFEKPALVTSLARASGGSLRDLIRLLGYAQLEAQVTNGEIIDAAANRHAINQLREDYKRSLVPAGSYYPLLARIHTSGSDGLVELAQEDEDKAESARRFLRHLLNNGAVLEYNGDSTHFAVHPAVQRIKDFKQALKQLEQSASDGQSGE